MSAPDPPEEYLTPTAAAVERALAAHDYELSATVDAIDAAVPGAGGLFDPRTDHGDLAAAADRVAETADGDPPARAPGLDAPTLYVDGSSQGNPGPAGAGAVILDGDGTTVAELGRPVGSRTDNNTAEHAALRMGLAGVLARCEPDRLEVRIDSMTVIRGVWGDGGDADDAFAGYRRAIDPLLSAVDSEWTHLADADPNPADALATVTADVADLGPG